MNNGIRGTVLWRTVRGGDLQGKTVRKAYDGFASVGNPACIDAGVVPTVGFQHKDRPFPDLEFVGAAIFVCDDLFGIRIQGQRQDDTAILPYFQTGSIIVFWEINPYSDDDADEGEKYKQNDILFV